MPWRSRAGASAGAPAFGLLKLLYRVAAHEGNFNLSELDPEHFLNLNQAGLFVLVRSHANGGFRNPRSLDCCAATRNRIGFHMWRLCGGSDEGWSGCCCDSRC